MKKSLYEKSTGQDIPNKLEGKVTQDDILEKVKECYENLYNSAPSSESMNAIKGDISKSLRENILLSEAEVDKITPEIVKAAAANMKPFKSDVSGSYTSDVFLHGPDVMFNHLALIFKSFLIHGTISKEVLCCAFLPLYKGGLKNPEKFDSYRAIAGSSQLLKLFEYVILLLWGDRLTSDSLQFGFKKGVGTTQCSWLVMEVANYFIQRGEQVTACFLDCSKAFDKCYYDKLFSKMQAKNIPAIVIRALIFAYEEQKGWVRLCGQDSDQFKIANGTRQGSVLSPHLFSACYLDDLIAKLRKMDLGCHIAGLWFGVCAYADDLVLLCNNRDILQRMVTVCQDYGAEHNLVFSTDPDPRKSKTKCVLFTAHSIKSYPVKVVLDNKDLPWVDRVEHLGHILQQNGSMEADGSRARASFMSHANDIRDNLYFATPEQRVKAIQLYCCDGYGTMLWNFRSDYAESFFKAWNIQIRNSWKVSYMTHTYLVEDYFASGYLSLRNQIYSRYAKFVQKLSVSPSNEIRFLYKVLLSDPRSNIQKNVWFLNNLTSVDICKTSTYEVKQLLPVNITPVEDKWRLGLLTVFFNARKYKNYQLPNFNSQLEMFIESLCTT